MTPLGTASFQHYDAESQSPDGGGCHGRETMPQQRGIDVSGSQRSRPADATYRRGQTALNPFACPVVAGAVAHNDADVVFGQKANGAALFGLGVRDFLAKLHGVLRRRVRGFARGLTHWRGGFLGRFLFGRFGHQAP